MYTRYSTDPDASEETAYETGIDNPPTEWLLAKFGDPFEE